MTVYDGVFHETVERWFEHELSKLDPTKEEADILRDEFKNREKNVWTIVSYQKHMVDHLRKLRMGF